MSETAKRIEATLTFIGTWICALLLLLILAQFQAIRTDMDEFGKAMASITVAADRARDQHARAAADRF